MRIHRRAGAAAAGLLLAVVIWRVAASGSGGGSKAPVPRLGALTTRLADDFSSGSGWTVSSSESVRFGFEGGRYVLRLDRPGDDGVSVLALVGRGWPSVAATATVETRGPAGGLVGVGCAAGKDRGYIGAVDPAGSGFVILRASASGLTLLRAGADDRGAIRGVGRANEVQVQCTLGTGRVPATTIRLFAGGLLLGASEDRQGPGAFNGIALAGISLRRPLEASYARASLQSLPIARSTPIAAACETVAAAGSVENDYAWLLDSGATRTQTPDQDRRQVGRVARELTRVSTALLASSGVPGVGSTARGSLRELAARLRHQGEWLHTLEVGEGGAVEDVSGASDALACPAQRYFPPPGRTAQPAPGPPARSTTGRLTGVGRSLDEELAGALPAPAFAQDDSPPLQAAQGVQVDLRYDSFRVFGDTIGELNRSLRVHAVHVESELAAGVTSSRFEVTYDPRPGPGGSGCTLQPHVGLSLLVTMPDWQSPAAADRYVRNQWNQFMWDLDDHERHHAILWIEAANEMAAAIEATPPGPRCPGVVTEAKARAGRVFRRFDRMQRRFDADVAAGRLPRPSLP